MGVCNAAGESTARAKYAGQTVLAIGAHPDDVEVTVGGTVARWSRSDCRVVIAIVSIPDSFRPRVYVDITETIELKMAAIDAHVSQFAAQGLDIERMLVC